MNRRRIVVAVGMLLLISSTAFGAGTPQQQCQATKNRTAAKYAACRQNAEAKLATSGEMLKYNDALDKCEAKFVSAWQKAVAKATAVGATCLDDPLGDSDFQTVIDGHTNNIATALGGGGLINYAADLTACNADLAMCGNDLTVCVEIPKGQVLKTGQTTCWDAANVVIPCAGTGQDGEFQAGLARLYVDNGDGTITDEGTGLMWEKLADDGSIHDWDNVYTWADAFAGKISTLNVDAFAGHSDWRLPNILELQSLVNFSTFNPAVFPAFHSGCVPGCTVATCSCTRSPAYWSSTTYPWEPDAGAWWVSYVTGQMHASRKWASNAFYVRAVRGGL